MLDGVAALDGTLWSGEAYVFSSPKQHLDHAQVKGFRVLVFYVPLFSLAELLSCKSRLTQYQVIITCMQQLPSLRPPLLDIMC